MSKLPNYNKGDTVSVRLRVKGATNIADRFRVDVMVYTTPNGPRVQASSADCSGCLPLVVTDSNHMIFTLPASLTAAMDPGLCRMETRYTHKASGAVRIFKNELMTLGKSQITKEECSHE